MANSSLDAEILEEYAKHHSLFKTARKLGVDVSYVSQVVEAAPSQVAPDLSQCRFEGNGDPEKEAYLVGRMLATEVWDNSIPAVAEARGNFEAGTHDLATGRDGPYILLYSFPRAVKQPRPNYFQLKTEV